MRSIILLLLGLLVIAGCTTGNTEKATSAVAATGELKEFTLTARNWEFEPSTIRVNAGDSVKLTITSIDVIHGFSLSSFGVNEFLEPGKTVEVEFLADKRGTFRYVCSVACGRGHSGMRGQLIVE